MMYVSVGSAEESVRVVPETEIEVSAVSATPELKYTSLPAVSDRCQTNQAEVPTVLLTATIPTVPREAKLMVLATPLVCT
jgi:hypothetical protein